jgi:hypothetical protein
MTTDPGCNGCQDSQGQTPLPVDNRPGLPALATRIGTFSSFRATMLDQLAGRPELAALSTRDSDDHSIAVLEQWAALADVLTFYGERYANEAYLRTATRDDSVHRLVRLIGYRPRPGVSATTTLAFTLSDGTALTLQAGFAAQNVPAPGGQPQTFETLEDCAADARLNTLPARSDPVPADPLRSPAGARADIAAVADLARQLHKGDAVLMISSGIPGSVTPCTVADIVPAAEQLRVLFTAAPPGTDSADAYRPRRRLRVFGWDAPETSPPTATLDNTVPGGVRWNWGVATDFSIRGASLPLDRLYTDIGVGAQLLLSVAGKDTRVVTVTALADVPQQIYGPTVTVTTLTLDTDMYPVGDRRTIEIVELLGGPLPFADTDYGTSFGTQVWIPGVALDADGPSGAMQVAVPPSASSGTRGPVISAADLAAGRRVVLADGAGDAVATTVSAAPQREPGGVGGSQSCHLVVPLTASAAELAVLDPQTTRLLGNAAFASNGKTVPGEVLGDGDASAAFINFPLAKGPLSRVPSPTPDGSTPAIEVTVDGVRWGIVDELLSAAPGDEVVALATQPDGTTVVQFGDGVNGARPSTGTGNVAATYRYGAGVAGRVAAASITQASARPRGFDTVTNPLPGQGGADPEGGTALAVRAPGTVRILDRAVTAADYAGVLVATALAAKAQAATVWDGDGNIIAITVAAEDAGTYDSNGLQTLAAGAAASGPPYRQVMVMHYAAVPIAVSATVTPDPRYDPQTVLAGVQAAIAGRLAFDQVALGQPLHLSDLYAIAQPVPGVVNVNITQFGFSEQMLPPGPLGGSGGAPVQEVLPMLPTRASSGAILPAQLPTLAAADLAVTLASAQSAPVTGGQP